LDERCLIERPVSIDALNDLVENVSVSFIKSILIIGGYWFLATQIIRLSEMVFELYYEAEEEVVLLPDLWHDGVLLITQLDAHLQKKVCCLHLSY
jgi:hypothetical protein